MPPITDIRRLEAIIALALLTTVIALLVGLPQLHLATLALLLTGLLSKTVSHLLAAGWWRLGWTLGKVSTTLLLALVFFLLLTPMGVLVRSTGRLAGELTPRRMSPKLRVREHAFTAADLENPW